MVGANYTNTPIGKIIGRGEPLINVEKVLTCSAKAGMLIEIDGNDYKCKTATGAISPAGWISYEHSPYNYRPDNYETEFVSGDVVSIVSGGNFTIYALATGEDDSGDDWVINIGDRLASNSDGTLTKLGTSGTEAIPVAIAVESITITKAATPAVVRIHVRSLI